MFLVHFALANILEMRVPDSLHLNSETPGARDCVLIFMCPFPLGIALSGVSSGVLGFGYPIAPVVQPSASFSLAGVFYHSCHFSNTVFLSINRGIITSLLFLSSGHPVYNRVKSSRFVLEQKCGLEMNAGAILHEPHPRL